MASTKAEIGPPDESAHAVTHDSRTSGDVAGVVFGDVLRARREQRGWNKTELAVALQYDRSYVSHVEGGTGQPSRAFAERADDVLGADGELVALWAQQRAGRRSGTAVAGAPRLQLLESHADVQAALWSLVDEAERMLVCSGSRSRDERYLRLIEDRLRSRPGLAYYRVPFGPPWRPELREHLLRVLKIRDPSNTAKGAGKSVFIGLFDDRSCEPERFICANERRALLPQLSLHGLSWYDTALVVNDPLVASMWTARMQEAYRHGRPVETEQEIRGLALVDGPDCAVRA